jgi:hypothetical protein
MNVWELIKCSPEKKNEKKMSVKESSKQVENMYCFKVYNIDSKIMTEGEFFF